MPVVVCCLCLGCGAQTPSCDTPELQRIRDVLLGGDRRAKNRLFEQELYPMALRPREVPDKVQRCLIEALLTSRPPFRRRLGRFFPGIERMFRKGHPIEVEYGVPPFYHFYQPDYLERLFLRVPAPILVTTYGREVIPLILKYRHNFDGTLRFNLVNLVEWTLVDAESGGLRLEPEERERLERILKAWVEDLETRQGEYGHFSHLRFDLRFGPEEWRRNLVERSRTELCQEGEWGRIHVLQDMVVLELPGTLEVLEELVSEEEDEEIARYVEALAAYHRGESESFPRWTGDLDYRVSLGYEHEMADLEICSTS
jgi:hypothetical protein